jgi:cholesterol transport system auxiliary component
VIRHLPVHAPHRARFALPLIAALALAGCLSIGDRAELAVYAPTVVLAVAEDTPRLERTLAIAEPSASNALDTTRIAVRPAPGRLQVYAGAIWSDTAPALVQAALVDALGGSGRFQAVVRPTDGVATDLLLRLDLRQFEAVYAEGAQHPTVIVDLHATLVDPRGRRVAASRRFRAEQPAVDEALDDVVPAFEAALGEIASTLLPWVLEHGTDTAP